MENDGFGLGLIGGLVGGAIASLILSAMFLAPAMFDSGYNNGYCTAMGGQILSADICAKDGQIIPIPPRP